MGALWIELTYHKVCSAVGKGGARVANHGVAAGCNDCASQIRAFEDLFIGSGTLKGLFLAIYFCHARKIRTNVEVVDCKAL